MFTKRVQWMKDRLGDRFRAVSIPGWKTVVPNWVIVLIFSGQKPCTRII